MLSSLLLLLLKATVILLAALGITLAMQRAAAGTRHLVWLVTLGTLLFVPVLTAWGPLRLHVLPPAERVVPNSTRAAPGGVEQSNRMVIGTPSAPATTPAAPAPSRSMSDVASRLRDVNPVIVLLAIWSAVVVAIGASLGYASLVVRHIVRQGRLLDTPDWRAPLYEVADRLGLDEPPRLLRSEIAKMPFACGVLRPTIVLPAECDGWSLDRRQAVLLHELAHIRRHDLVGHTLGRLTCAIYWFHPLVWTAAKRLRSESERACDDLALSCGTRATDYAEHLLDIVTSVRRDGTPSVALAMARRKEFEGRMLAILDPELRRGAPSRRQSAVLIASLALVSVAVGAAAPVPRVEPDPVGPTTAVTRGALSTPRESAAAPKSVTPPVARADNSKRTTLRTQTSAVVRESTAMDLRMNVVTSPAPSPAPSADPASKALGLIGRASDKRGSGPDDERPQLLAKVLRTDTNSTLRRIAAWGLSEYASAPVAAEALAAALKRDADWRVREMSAWSLGEGDDELPAAVEALTGALRSDDNIKVRVTSAWALGNIGNRGSTDALVSALADANSDVRMRALWALGNIEHKKAPAAVIAALADKDASVRELAAWVLFNIEDPAAAPALQKALRAETNSDLQIAYIRALAALGERSVDALRDLLESSDPAVKQIAVRALAGGHATGPWPWPWPEPRPNP